MNKSKSVKTPNSASELLRLLSSSFSLMTLPIAPKAKKQTSQAHHQPFKLLQNVKFQWNVVIEEILFSITAVSNQGT